MNEGRLARRLQGRSRSNAGQARHAIDLSLSKYCSVTHSLAQDIVLRHELVLEA